MVVGVALGVLAPVVLGIAFASEGVALSALDVGIILACDVLVDSLLRRQLRKEIATARSVHLGARLDGDRATVRRGVRLMVLVAVLLGLPAQYGGGSETVICVTFAVVFVGDALRLRRWERRTGNRVYRERSLRWRGAPFFVVRVESLADSKG
jgi:hypothetical protein